MDDTGYTTVYNEGGLLIQARGEALPDIGRLSAALMSLSTEAPPTGTDRVVYANDGHRWGRAAFAVGGMFVKADWACLHADRRTQFGCVEARIGNHERCEALGLPVPRLLGRFARFDEGEGWMWGGTVARYLSGWRQLLPGETGLLEAAEERLSAAGVYDRDLTPANVMTDGSGRWLVVDLDDLSFQA